MQKRDLPPNVHRKGNALYYVKTIDGKRKWTPINDKIWRDVIKDSGDMYMWIESRGKSILSQAKTRCSAVGREFSLTHEQLITLFERSAGRCEVTGIPLVFGNRKNREDRQWIPSLDRIDSSKGYTFENCRIVCLAANIAMNEWGPDVILKLAEGIKQRRMIESLPDVFVKPTTDKMVGHGGAWSKIKRIQNKKEPASVTARRIKREQCAEYLRNQG